MQRITTRSDPPALLIVAALALVGAAIAFTGHQLLVVLALLGAGALLVVWKNPHLGILIFLTTFLFKYPESFEGHGVLTLNNMLGVVFCLLLLVHVFEQKSLWALHDVRIRILLAISVVFLASTWLARDPPQDLAYLDRTRIELWAFFTQFAFVIFMIHFVRTQRQLNQVVGLFLFAIIITGVSALFSAGTGYRAAAVFGIDAASNPNRLGFYCLSGVTLLWYLRQDLDSHAMKSILLGVAGMLLVVVFLTGSRSALIGTLVFAATVALEAGIQPRRLFATSLILLASAFLVLKLVPQQNLERITSFESGTRSYSDSYKPTLDAYKSAENRLQVARVAIEVYLDNNPVLGVGPGNFRWIRQLEYDLKRLSLHNGYLWALLSGGAAALALYLTLFWTCWRDLRRLEKSRSPRADPPIWMIRSTRTILLLFLVFSLFAEVWLDVISFLIIGLTIAMLRIARTEVAGPAPT